MASDSDNSNPKTRDKKGKAKQNYEGPRATTAINAFVNEYRTDRKERESQNNKRRFREWLTIIGLFLAAGAAIVQANIFSRQLEEMKTTSEQTVETLKAFKRIADATEITGDAAERQLRAYVYVKMGNVLDYGAGKQVRVLLGIENAGKTPAYEVQQFITIGVHEWPSGEGIVINEIPPENTLRAVILPGEGMVVGTASDFPLNRDQIAKINSGEKFNLYVCGIVRYVDVFKKPHLTKFCASTGGPEFAKAAAAGKTDFHWEYTSPYNEHD